MRIIDGEGESYFRLMADAPKGEILKPGKRIGDTRPGWTWLA